jgi:O-antigen/teichoic acid export membrane protein
MKHLAFEYRDFPIYSASARVINTLSVGLPVLLLAQFYGLTVAGAYAFGMRILQTPTNLILIALRQVLFQKVCEKQHQGGNLLPIYLQTTIGLFAAALIPSLILFIWSPDIFAWIFGSQWRAAGEFARWLVLWLLFMFSNVPSVLFARALRLQRQLFLFDVLVLLARASALVAGGLYLAAIQSIVLFSVVGVIMNLVFIIIVFRALRTRSGDVSFNLDAGGAAKE